MQDSDASEFLKSCMISDTEHLNYDLMNQTNQNLRQRCVVHLYFKEFLSTLLKKGYYEGIPELYLFSSKFKHFKHLVSTTYSS